MRLLLLLSAFFAALVSPLSAAGARGQAGCQTSATIVTAAEHSQPSGRATRTPEAGGWAAEPTFRTTLRATPAAASPLYAMRLRV